MITRAKEEIYRTRSSIFALPRYIGRRNIVHVTNLRRRGIRWRKKIRKRIRVGRISLCGIRMRPDERRFAWPPPPFREADEAIAWLAGWYLETYPSQPQPGPSAHALIATELFESLAIAVEEGRHAGQPRSHADLTELVSDDADPDSAVRKALSAIAKNIRFFCHTKSKIGELAASFRPSLVTQLINEDHATVSVGGRELIAYLTYHARAGEHWLEVFFRAKPHRVQLSLDDTNFSGEIDEAIDSSSDYSKLAHLLGVLGSDLPSHHRWEFIIETITLVWHTVAIDPYRAALIRQSPIPPELVSVFDACLSIAASEELTPAQCSSLFSTLDTISNKGPDAAAACAHFERQVIRRLCLQQPALLTVAPCHHRLENRAEIEGAGWPRFFVGLFYRVIASQTPIAANTLSILRGAAEKYRGLASSNTPLAELWRFFVDPIGVVADQPIDVTLARLKAIAARCRTVSDISHCVRAFRRVVPAYDCYADDFEASGTLREILEDVTNDRVRQSSYFCFEYLRAALYEFMATRNVITKLRKFERLFLRLHRRLAVRDLLLLQLEYAAAVYVAIEARAAVYQTMLFNHLHRELPITAWEPLQNEVVDLGSIHTHVEADRPHTVAAWLQQYVSKLFRLHRQFIDANLLAVQQFRCATLVPTVRKQLQPLVFERLIALGNTNSPAELFAATQTLFRFVDPAKHLGDIHAHLTRAVTADQYSVVRHSPALSIAAHKCFFFSEDSRVREDARLLTTKIQNALSHVPTTHPRFAEIYRVTTRYANSAPDQEFVAWFTQQLQVLRMPLLAVLNLSDHQILHTIQDRMRRTLENYHGRSALPPLLLKYYDQPTLWNVLGTTVAETGERRVDALERAATFYALAGVAARSVGEFDQLPSFNYIRARSEAMLRGAALDGDFLVFTAQYLAHHSARHFEYWKESIQPYLALLRSHPTSLDENTCARLRVQMARLVRSGIIDPASLPVELLSPPVTI